jgi:hypothetical protein
MTLYFIGQNIVIQVYLNPGRDGNCKILYSLVKELFFCHNTVLWRKNLNFSGQVIISTTQVFSLQTGCGLQYLREYIRSFCLLHLSSEDVFICLSR